MCKCDPSIKTPFCGKPGCEWSKQKLRMNKYKINQLFEEIQDEIFKNSTDEEYNVYMSKVQELQKEICNSSH
jgi:hypothetical protein